MADSPADQLIQQLLDSHFLSAEDATELTQSASSYEDLKQRLIDRKIVTQQQLEILADGKLDALVIDHYRIEEILGAGGMGVVFRAVHQTLNRQVALKIISSFDVKQSDVKKEEALKRFQREAELLARMHHPNIAMAYDAACDRGIHFLAMEFIPGKNLSDRVRQEGVLELGEALCTLRQAAAGLSYAHELGIVHRDVKPSNLIVNEVGVLKVLDCGLARIVNTFSESEDAETMSELTMSGVVIGTANYMSPEQAENVQQADERSDIYSLGCTFWFLLTGGPLHEADSALQTILKHREQPIPSLLDARDDADADLQAIIASMVAKDPVDRYQSMQELIEDIDRYIAEKFGPEGIHGPVADKGENSNRIVNQAAMPSSSPTVIQNSRSSYGRQRRAENFEETSSINSGFWRKSDNAGRTLLTGLIGVVAILLIVMLSTRSGTDQGRTGNSLLETLGDQSGRAVEEDEVAIPVVEFGPHEIIQSFDLWEEQSRQIKLVAQISRQASSRSDVELPDHFRLEARIVRLPAPRAPFESAGTTHFEMKIGNHFFEFYLNNGGDQPIDNPSNGFVFLDSVPFSTRRVQSSPDIIKERFLREKVLDHVIFEVHADEENDRGEVILTINAEEKYRWSGALSSFQTVAERFDDNTPASDLMINQWNGVCLIKSVTLEPVPATGDSG